ncbi:MAG: hypothetical protein UZ07_CHB004001892 [Chlorobi bacterium OLB7]|nr:MAG: hypothetical protein UZ07_CHB004001892 [Chlorobi bacterium OLB7]
MILALVWKLLRRMLRPLFFQKHGNNPSAISLLLLLLLRTLLSHSWVFLRNYGALPVGDI